MKTTVKASVTFLFDSRRNKEGIYTICWNIYFNGKQKPFSTGIKISRPDMEWLKENKAGVDGRQKDPWRRNLWQMLYGASYLDPDDNQPKDSLTVMAQRVIDSIRFFTFDEFKVRINDYENLESYGRTPTDTTVIPNDLLKLLQQTAIELKENDQIGSYSSHMDTKASLIRFCEYSGRDPELPFESITVGFLNEYEKWMLKYGKAPRAIAKESNLRDQARHPEKYKPKPASEATVGVYTRYIRKMMLIALGKKLITEDEYPFKGNKSFTIPAISNAARALELEDVGKIMQYQPENDAQALYRDLWIFSYLSNGLNVMDTCNLKWGYYNVAQGTIRFFREKTKRTSKGDKKEILIHLFPEAVEIIDKWATKGTDADDFIFPFFKCSMDAARRKSVANQVVIMINQTMAVVSQKMELPFRVTSNDARDTQATVLMKSGAPLPFIQSVLGHHDLKTTQKYFGRFSGEKSKEIMAVLLPSQTKK